MKTVVTDVQPGFVDTRMDRATSVPARLYLDDQNQVWLEFTGTQASQIVRRRIGLGGDETTRTPR
jgi:hypothetical protein